MLESTYIPNGRLCNYVKFMWCNENYNPENDKERVLPSGSSQLIININNKKFRHFSRDKSKEKWYDPAIIAGIQSGHLFLDSYSRISTIGVVLKPGAIPAFFQIPADEFENKVVSLESILKRDVSELCDQLSYASTHKKKFRIMELFLNKILDPQHQLKEVISSSIQQIHFRNGTQSMSEILEQTGYSRRWFSQIFRNTVGISPKQYARIQRFQHNLKIIRENSSPDWTQLALSTGYFDQAHFINDFKNLSGLSPSEYFRNQGPSANHLSV